MHVRELGQGEGPPVLLLHGQLLPGSVWDPVLAPLAATRRLLVPDLPGHGPSPALTPWTFEGVRGALEEALAARGVAALDVAAYSLGTYHALTLALAGRVEVRRLHLLGALAGVDAAGRETYRAFAVAVRGGLDAARAFVDLALPPAWTAAHPDEARAAYQAASRASPAVLAAELEGMASMPDLRPRLGELSCPVRLRVGSEDRNTPAEWSREIARLVPRAELELVPGLGHLSFLQDPAGTGQSLVTFLTP